MRRRIKAGTDYYYDVNGCLRRRIPKVRGMKKKQRRALNRAARAEAQQAAERAARKALAEKAV